MQQTNITPSRSNKALFASTFLFALAFATWTLFSIIGLTIKDNLGLNDAEFGILVATPVLTGALSRLFLGVLADQFGGRIVFVLVLFIAAAATWSVSLIDSYPMYLLAGLGVGLTGGTFSVGVAYVSRWYPKGKQGTALGIFGIGVAGSAITSFGAPLLMAAYGWDGTARIYATILVIAAVLFWFVTEDDPTFKERRANKQTLPFLKQFEPLKKLQVWRFSLYYFFVFGGFVALALWLPKYYMGVYGLDIKTAGLLTTLFALPGGIFRAVGGILSDKYGARRVMYWTFIACVICTFILSYPATTYIVKGIEADMQFAFAISLPLFAATTFILSIFMSFGMAAVFKHIPVYYPNHVGAVGGMVGLIGGLGGFILPIIFGISNDVIGVWTSCFMLLFALVSIAFVWMHITVIYLERREHPSLRGPKFLPELDVQTPVKS
jgi:NNP family nitrate/nitrite transporter-like MFS transporter